MPKQKQFRVFMESPDQKRDGRALNRTIELQADDDDQARRRAERQADDIADQYEEKAYKIKKIEEVK
jgi:hypothetical protein